MVPTIQAQARLLVSHTPSCSSVTGMQLREMFVPKPSEDNGKHVVKPNYLNQCKTRLRKYQSDAMRDFADMLYMSFANGNKFRQFGRCRNAVCL